MARPLNPDEYARFLADAAPPPIYLRQLSPVGARILNEKAQSRDDFIVEALDRGFVKVNSKTGEVLRTRGPNGSLLTEPKPFRVRNNQGYCQVTIEVDGTKKTLYVHRIIWVANHGPAPKPLAGDRPYQVDHINRDPMDNRLVNLRLVSPRLNAANRGDTAIIKNKPNDLHPVRPLTDAEIKQIREDRQVRLMTLSRLSAKYDVPELTLRSILRDTAWEDRINKPGPTEQDLAQLPWNSERYELPLSRTNTTRSQRSQAIQELIEKSQAALPLNQPEHPGHYVMENLPANLEEPMAGHHPDKTHEYQPGQAAQERIEQKHKWVAGQARLLWRGQRLSKVPALYERAKQTYMATMGNATLTAQLCGLHRDTIIRYADKDQWPIFGKLGSGAQAHRTRLTRVTDMLEAKLMQMADSLVIETKDRDDLADKGLKSSYVASLAQRSSAFAIIFDRWLKCKQILDPETYSPDDLTRPSANALRLKAQTGGAEAVERQIAAFFAGAAVASTAGAAEQRPVIQIDADVSPSGVDKSVPDPSGDEAGDQTDRGAPGEATP